MKKVLVLGGTNFIGRTLVEQLIELGDYEITLFNRQLNNSTLFPELNKIKGDRETDDIKQISTQSWNYVIDLSCYYPHVLNSTISALKQVDQYVFISTCSAYNNEDKKGFLKKEQADLLSCNVEQQTDRNPESYGNRKAECERILGLSGISHTILRPALVFGKYDPTDRLYYWLYQVKKCNTLLLPDKGERLFSTTYCKDLVETIIKSMSSAHNSETLNVISNPTTSIAQIVNIAKQYLKQGFFIVDAPQNFLQENNINQWIDMPLWINGDHFTYSNQKLKEALRINPTNFSSAIEQTIAYYDHLNWPEPTYGLNEQTKQALIKKLEA